MEVDVTKLSSEVDFEENKRKLWALLFDTPPPSPKRIDVLESAGIVSRLLGRVFKEEELRDFLESDE